MHVHIAVVHAYKYSWDKRLSLNKCHNYVHTFSSRTVQAKFVYIHTYIQTNSLLYQECTEYFYISTKCSWDKKHTLLYKCIH